MNENIDLIKILKGCPIGTKFYSPFIGDVEFDSIDSKFVYVTTMYGNLEAFNKCGRYYKYDGECMLLPSKDQRDWAKFKRFWDKPKKEKFDTKDLRPFDKILVRDAEDIEWCCALFSHLDSSCEFPVATTELGYKWCIPYNEETKHLVDTKEDCPEYYKWWEE